MIGIIDNNKEIERFVKQLDIEPEMLVLMSGCGVLGGLAGSRINRRIGNEEMDKLFRGLMGVIICISIYNVFRYM